MSLSHHITVTFDVHLLKLVESAASVNGLSLEDFARMSILSATRGSLSQATAASEAFVSASDYERKRLAKSQLEKSVDFMAAAARGL